MPIINKTTKALRLVTGRRYGSLSDNTIDNQEPFTSTIDIASSDVYTQTSVIPFSKSPFSGSDQNGHYLLADGTIDASGVTPPPANAVLRYWYRHSMTEGQVGQQEVWYFYNPAGASEFDFADPQQISDAQETNFISNKYITGSSALNGTETGQPTLAGYNVVVSWLSQAQINAGIPVTQATIINPAYYAFDYKTGVLQFTGSATEIGFGFGGAGQGQGTRVYVTAVQYVGKTLNTTLTDLQSQIDNIDGTGGGSGNYISSSNGNYIVSASNDGILVRGNLSSTPVTIANLTTTVAEFKVSVSASAGITGSLLGTGSWAQVAVSASITDNTNTNATYYPVFVATSGDQRLNIDTSTLSYNPSTNILTTTASLAATASNITNAFVGSVALNNQILISKGTGQVTGSSNFAFNGATNILNIGEPGTDVAISPTTFDVAGNTYTFAFGSVENAIQITNAGNSATGLITFNLSASFTAPTTFTNASNATFDDQFILVGSGSTQTPGGDKDSGIVFEYGTSIGSGSALFFDAASSKRLAFRYSASVSNTAMDPQAFVNMTFVQGLNGSITSRADVDTLFNNVGGDNTAANTMKGFMFIDNDGNIYIKA